MSRLISSLPLGAMVKDPFGIAPHGDKKWSIISHNHNGSNRTLLWFYDSVYSELGTPLSSSGYQYLGSILDSKMSIIYNALSSELKSCVVLTSISAEGTAGTFNRYLFPLSKSELFDGVFPAFGDYIPYLYTATRRKLDSGRNYWMRSLSTGNVIDYSGQPSVMSASSNQYARYAFNVSGGTKVTDTIQPDGTYHLVWNASPSKPTIDTLSKDQANPSITSLTETITFKATDPDGDAIESFNIVVKDITTNTEVVNETKNQSELSFKILYGSLQPNKIYSIKVRVKDDQQNWSEFSDLSYMINKTFMITLDKNVILNDGDQIEFVEMDAITNGQEMALKSIDNENKKYVFELDELNNATTVNLEIKSKSNNLEDILYTVS